MDDELRIDDLQWGGLKLMQSKKYFSFGTDAVLLSHFFAAKGEKRVCDIGCGTGILSVLIGGKNRDIEVFGVEIQPELADIARKNCDLNALDNVHIIEGDITKVCKDVPRCTSVICNPPYEKQGTGKLPADISQRTARYELTVDFAGIVSAAACLLGDGGRFYFIHKSMRFTELAATLAASRFSVKSVRFIYPDVNKGSELVMVCAQKNVREGVKVLPPLIIYENGEYTAELKNIYRPHGGV